MAIGAVEVGVVRVGMGPVSRDEVVAVARHDARVTLAPDALAALAATRQRIEALAEADRPV